MRLQRVVDRKPVGHRPHPDRCPDYIVCYCVETLECGHAVTTFYNPPSDSLIAKRRECKNCAVNLTEFPSPPKREDKKAA